MKKVNKFLYGWSLAVSNGKGWKRVIFETNYKTFCDSRRDFLKNCAHPNITSYGRAINPKFQKL